MNPSDVLMLIGDADLLHHAERLRPGDVVALVALPGCARSEEPSNTIMVDLDRVGVTHVEARTIDGSRRLAEQVEGPHLLQDRTGPTQATPPCSARSPARTDGTSTAARTSDPDASVSSAHHPQPSPRPVTTSVGQTPPSRCTPHTPRN
jgi:hypothetical protein